mgnify:CR=1 FL=1
MLLVSLNCKVESSFFLYLKGGDLTEELKRYTSATVYNLPNFFEEDFFETKKVVHLGMKFK